MCLRCSFTRLGRCTCLHRLPSRSRCSAASDCLDARACVPVYAKDGREGQSDSHLLTRGGQQTHKPKLTRTPDCRRGWYVLTCCIMPRGHYSPTACSSRVMLALSFLRISAGRFTNVRPFPLLLLLRFLPYVHRLLAFLSCHAILLCLPLGVPGKLVFPRCLPRTSDLCL